MSIKKHGLGKGIESLIGEYDPESAGKVKEIELDKIKPNPNQPRKAFDSQALNELKESIISQGVLQPILIEEISNENYVIIAGERRYRASKLAGLTKIPALVKSFSDIQRLEVSLIENIQRENLNPVEEAKAFALLINSVNISQEELAKRLGKSRPAIANSIRILQLPQAMLEALEKGLFSPGHARALLSVVNPADQEILFKKILDENLSVRQTEYQANLLNKGKRAVKPKEETQKSPNTPKSPELLSIEEKFLSATGCRIEVKGSPYKGKLEIPFDSPEELERIYQLLSPGGELFEY